MSIHKKLAKHKVFKDKRHTADQETEYISTGVITLNLLHSGKVRGGVEKGNMSMISADPALGKSFIGLATLKKSQDLGMECIVIDSEKSFDFKWAETIGIDTSPDKLTIVRVSDIVEIGQLIEEMKVGYTLEQRQNVFVLFDSWGPLITHVIIKKALDGNEAKDMSLPQWKNTLANLMKETDFTYYIVNHVYDNTGGFGDPQKVPGGKKLYFNCESVVLCQSKAKDKKGDDITGAIVTAYTHKGRKAVERSKLKYRIKHDGGLDPWYGLLPDALEGEYVVKVGNKYTRSCVDDDKSYFEKNIYTGDFWIPIFRDTDFEEYLTKKYTFEGRKIDLAEEDITELLDFKRQ